jgi:NAD(P)-dependent dehydrogenase (short-subunit alcohol dehydrogenase family)
MQQLRDRTAVVTGAGSGIGAALARRFGQEAMRLVLADVEAAALAETSAALLEAGVEHTTQVVDVSDGSAMAALADHAYATFGEVHVLCNNAGVFAGGSAWTQSPADYEWVLGVNLWGVIHGIRAFVPRMIEQDTEGHIITTSSAAGMFGSAYTGPYAATKFAAFGLTECLAKDFEATGSKLRASVLCPGLVDTGIARSSRNREAAPAQSEDAAAMDQILADSIAGRTDPMEVADRVVDALGDGRFLIVTHPAYAEEYVERAKQLATGAMPPNCTFQ